jgi:F-type H+-transporting ATPase subunit b
VKRRLVLLAMTLVTAWSLWAFAQTKHAGAPSGPAAGPGAVHAGPPAGPAAGHAAPPTGRPAPPGARPNPAGPAGGRAPEPAARASEHGEGEATAQEESEEPAAINWTDFGKETPPYLAMIINFGILVAGYYLLGKQPIANALQGRRDSIAKDIEEAQRMKVEAESRAKVYQAKLETLEEEVRTAREGLVRAGEAERDRIVAEAEAKAERMHKDAEFLVGQELKQIRQDLLRDTVEAAVTAAEELLRKRVTPADQERLAEDYLADLGGKRAPQEAAVRSEAGEPS